MISSGHLKDSGYGSSRVLSGWRSVLNGESGELRPFEVHSVRPVRRIGPDGQQRTDLVVEITQSWLPGDGRGNFEAVVRS